MGNSDTVENRRKQEKSTNSYILYRKLTPQGVSIALVYAL